MKAVPTEAKRRGRALILALLAALCVTMGLSASASAALPEYTGVSFSCSEENPCTESASPEEWAPGLLAVDEETDDVYVIDLENDALQVFDADGNYESSILGGSIPGDGTFGFGGDDDVAIDNSGGVNQGNVYVNAGYAKFYAFDANGDFLWQRTGAGEPCGIGVDTAGNLYGSAYGGGVQQLSIVDGSPVGDPIVSSASIEDTCQIAFDSEDNLYLRRWESPNTVSKHLASASYATPGVAIDSGGASDVDVNRVTNQSYVTLMAGVVGKILVYEPNGTPAPGVSFGAGTIGEAGGVAVNSSSETVYVSDSLTSEGTDEIHIFGTPATPEYAINVTVDGTGSGSVSADTGAISGCTGSGGVCSDEYLEGTEVTLTATPGSGSEAAWSGCPFPVGDECTILVEGEVDVSATFDTIQHELTVSKSGEGSGTITSSPTGIDCGAICVAEFDEGTVVTLSQVPASGSTFTGWSGACSGEEVCEVTMGAAESVSAGYTLIDSDGDGVPDNTDACPSQSGSEPNGCPPAKVGSPGGGSPGPVTVTPPVVMPPAAQPNALGKCLSSANKSFAKAKRKAAKEKGKAKANGRKAAKKRKAKAISRAKKRKAKAVSRCTARFA